MICRRYRAEDKADVLALLRRSFAGWHGDRGEAYWEWKFERNPHGPALIWVGDDGGRIAGCYIWIPVRIRLGAREILGAQSVDAAVDPDYRGQGVFSELARTAIEESGQDGIELAFAFPTEGAFKGQVRVGFQPQFPVRTTSRPLPGLFVRRRRFTDLSWRILERFDPRFDVFASSSDSGELAVERDADYLRWRYNDHPVRRYEVLVCERADQVCGYSVLSIEPARRRIAPGYVVDLQVLPGFDAAAQCLAHNSLRRLHELGARIAVSWERSSGPVQDALSSTGFSSRYESFRRRLKRPHYEGQFILFEGPGMSSDRRDRAPNWSLAPGDADYI